MRARPTAEDGGMATKKSEKRQRNKTVHIRLTDAELVRILSQLGKIGSNVNQIARAVNSGDDPNGLSDDIKAAVVALAEIHAAAASALGWKPGMDA